MWLLFYISKRTQRFRFCILWTVIFMGGCLYILQVKYSERKLYHLFVEKTESENDIRKARNDDVNIELIYLENDTKIDRVENRKRLKKTENWSGFESRDKIQNKLYKSDINIMSSNDERDEIHGSENKIPKTLNNSQKNPGPVIINRHVPTYYDIVTQYWMSRPEMNDSRDSALPACYRKWSVHWTIRNSGQFPKSLYTPPPSEYPKQRLPKAILIGAGKCGTRALIEFMAMNPFIVTARNEVHYFDINLSRDLDWYLSQMPLSFSNQLTVEKSPSYLWSDRAPKEIFNMDKDIKLLVILKDPVERVISQAIRTKLKDIRESFLNEDVKINGESLTVKWGTYVNYIKIWVKTFPLKQIHIVEAKELANNPAKELRKIEMFLGVPPRITDSNFYYNETKGFHCMRPLHSQQAIVCLSEGKGRQHPDLEPNLEKMLYDHYLPFNEELFSLLGRRFEWNSLTKKQNKVVK